MASNYQKIFYEDYENLEIKFSDVTEKYKFEKLRADVAESQQQRLEKEIERKDRIIDEKDKIIAAYEKKVMDLQKQLDLTNYDKDNYLSRLNNDGTNSGLPTSQTPINKTKLTPNSRNNTGGKIGGKFGHKRNTLEKFDDNEINEHVDEILEKCPYCNSNEFEILDSESTKDESDYEIKVIKRRHHFKECKCSKCNKIFKKTIPTNLKEDNQYGSNVQSTALTLMNIGNVPINKVRRIICGLTMNEINLSEGFIAKLQKRAASKLEQFIVDLKFHIVHLTLVYWDDTVIMIATHRGCMRFYGNEDVALYCAHMHKDKLGLDDDNILNKLSSKTVVEHDHNKVNYNDEYSFINAECCQHLIRDLQKVSTNLPNRTWNKKLKELFQEYDHKRNELISSGIDHFTNEELDNFILKIDEYILLGADEYIQDSEVYYAKEERTLLLRLMEYRDNYIYWTYDFNLPFTNNLSERSLRGIKSKMKVSGQFQNINTAGYYAALRSYIETCHRNGINEHDALNRLIQGNPYSLKEILEIGKQNAEKKG